MLLIGGLVNRLGLRRIVRRLGQLVLGFVGGLVLQLTACGGLGFGHSGIDGVVALLAPLIYLGGHVGRLEAGLGLNVDRFLDKFAPAIKLSTTLFYLGCHRRLEPFAKESDESRLF